MTSHEKVDREFDLLRGRILGLIESWGLPERQEIGCKSTFKALTYDVQKTTKELLPDDGDASLSSDQSK